MLYRTVISTEEKVVLSLSIKPVNPEVPIRFSEIENRINQDKYLELLIENNNIIMKYKGILNEIKISSGMVKRSLSFEK